jgi:hypothetical protein
LRIGGRANGCGRRLERGKERVTLGAEDPAGGRVDRAADQLSMLLEERGVSVTECLDETRRPLDVGE